MEGVVGFVGVDDITGKNNILVNADIPKVEEVSSFQ